MSDRRRRLLIIALGILLIGFLFALTFANYRFAILAPGGNDLLPRWLGTRLWLTEGISPYDERVSLQAQEMIYGRPAQPERGEDVAHFVYPLPVVLFTAPLSLLPFPVARAIWMTVLEISLLLLALASARLVRWRPGPVWTGLLMAFVIFWYHGFRAVVLGQFAALGAVLVIGGLLAVDRRQDVLAGILLALSISKPQLAVLLLPLVVVWGISRRRWRLVLSTVLGVLGLTVVFMILLPTWPIEWLLQVTDYPEYTPASSPIAIAVGLLTPRMGFLAPVLSLVLLVYMVWEWILTWGADRSRFLWTSLLTLSITQIILIRTATTNFLVLLPGLFLLLVSWQERWGRKADWVIGGTLLVWLIVPWWLFLVTIDGNIEDPIMHLPLPFFVLLSLLWTRWWAIRGRNLVEAGQPVASRLRQ